MKRSTAGTKKSPDGQLEAAVELSYEPNLHVQSIHYPLGAIQTLLYVCYASPELLDIEYNTKKTVRMLVRPKQSQGNTQ